MHRLFILAVAIFAFVDAGGYQFVTIYGRTICEANITEAIVELWEKDTFDLDDKLNETSTINGEFEIKGGEIEVMSIKPYLYFIHTCRVKDGCFRKTRYDVPGKYINGPNYDMGLISLDSETSADEIIC